MTAEELARHFPIGSYYRHDGGRVFAGTISCSCGWRIDIGLEHLAQQRWAEHVVVAAQTGAL